MTYIYEIERPNGTTYEQAVQLRPYETPLDGAKRLKAMLGKSYWVCEWRRDDSFQFNRRNEK